MKIKNALLSGLLLCLVVGAQANAPQPESQRHNYILFFEILDYTREMGDAVSFFLTQVLEPGDQLIIYSPVRVYGFSRATLAQPKKDLVRSVQDKLRGDTAFCRTNYQVIMDDMKIQVREVADNISSQEDLKRSLSMYRQSLASLQSLRKVNEDLLRQVVGVFKANPGKNHAVMVFQAEFRPIPDKETMNRLRAMPIISFEANELFAETDQKPPFDAGAFSALFKEVPITLDFFYIKPKDVSMAQDIKEQSVDMYSVFSQMATATGGILQTTANPEAAFKELLRRLNAPAQ